MKIDPICGMQVDESTELKVERDGSTFYFCSDHCRQKFLQSPASKLPSAIPVSFSPVAKHDCCAGKKEAHVAQVTPPSATAKYFCKEQP